ncbi:MAG: hypothetical protein IT531_09305 [Burkholderiales bacterium]|nr:hypothetical protein [Burkholderiales bacterium]
MSGPIAIEYVLVSALLDAAWGVYQEAQQRRAEQAQREQALADRREHDRRAASARRDEERRAREEAKRRAEQAAALLSQAHSREQRLERARELAQQARSRFADVALEVPAAPAPPEDRADPVAIQRYLDALDATTALVQTRVREQAALAAGRKGAQELMSVLAQSVAGEARTAADLLALYAAEVKALARPAAAKAPDRRATAERILGRLAQLPDGELPSALALLMRALIEAESEERAEMLALELRAQVQQLNAAREDAERAETENRRREIAGVLVAEVLSDLGYEVEPIAETLFVSGGMAHFQRAEWGDYYVRMRVDPVTRNVNFNMVRTAAASAPSDAAQRSRDEAMEATWCAGIPKLLAELAARGIDTRKLRELDAGAVPVQVVKPETIDPVLRQGAQTQPQSAPRQMARPIK